MNRHTSCGVYGPVRSKQSAFTLVEVLIATAISFVLLIVLWSLFSGSVRQYVYTRRHLEAIQVAQLVLEFIENDLHAMVVGDDGDEAFFDGRPARLNSLAFHVSRADDSGSAVYRGERKSYGLEPASGGGYYYFKRDGRVFYNMPLKELRFEPIVADSMSGPGGTGSSGKIYFLRIFVTALDSSARQEFSLVGLVAIESLTMKRRWPWWHVSGAPVVRLQN